MYPSGIILAFAFVVLLLVLGLVLAGLGTSKLRQQVRTGFSARAAIVALTWQSLMVTLGLLFTFFSITAIYRLIWGG